MDLRSDFLIHFAVFATFIRFKTNDRIPCDRILDCLIDRDQFEMSLKDENNAVVFSSSLKRGLLGYKVKLFLSQSRENIWE